MGAAKVRDVLACHFECLKFELAGLDFELRYFVVTSLSAGANA
jgi:hypothetical protein